MTEGVDLRLVSGTSGERVVRRRRAIVIEAKHLAGIAVRILRAAAVAAAWRRHIELAVAPPREPRRAAHAGPATEDVFEVGDRGSIEPSACQRQRGLFLVDRLDVREVNESVCGELRMERDLHQT